MGHAPIGGGVKKPEMSQFRFGNLKNRGGGLYFSEMSELKIVYSRIEWAKGGYREATVEWNGHKPCISKLPASLPGMR